MLFKTFARDGSSYFALSDGFAGDERPNSMFVKSTLKLIESK